MGGTRHVPLSVSWSFSIALAGQNVIFGLQLSFLLFAFTDILGLLPTTVGTLLLLARLFDAANDPLMGYLADRTQSRWGKFRPWLLWSPLPLGVVTVLLFYNPGLPYEQTVMYAYVVYFLWTIIYTFTDIPLWSLSSTITESTSARTRLIAVARVASVIGMALPAVSIPLIAVSIAPDDKQSGYFFAVTGLVVLAVPMLMCAFFGIRENVETKPSAAGLVDVIRYLFGNWPLVLLMLNTLLSFMAAAGTAAVPYFSEYILGDSRQISVLIGLGLAGNVVGIMFTPWLVARTGLQKELIIWSSVARAALLVAFYFSGYGNLSLIYCFAFVGGMLGGPNSALTPVMIGDTIVHRARQTGERAEGIAFAAFTFSNKATSGLSAWLVGFVLASTGYVANQSQSDPAIEGIFWLMTLLPAASSLISIVPLVFYKLPGR